MNWEALFRGDWETLSQDPASGSALIIAVVVLLLVMTIYSMIKGTF